MSTFLLKQKDYEELSQSIFDLNLKVMEKDKEIERLNNIINEFDKWLNNIPNYFMDKRSNNTGVYVQKGMQQMIDMCKNKLKELKGSEKE